MSAVFVSYQFQRGTPAEVSGFGNVVIEQCSAITDGASLQFLADRIAQNCAEDDARLHGITVVIIAWRRMES